MVSYDQYYQWLVMMIKVSMVSYDDQYYQRLVMMLNIIYDDQYYQNMS